MADGHRLGNHSMHHDDMTTWSPGRIEADLRAPVCPAPAGPGVAAVDRRDDSGVGALAVVRAALLTGLLLTGLLRHADLLVMGPTPAAATLDVGARRRSSRRRGPT
ncbi:hypothetical protein AB0K25_28810 [Micromonospora sp. NPDC049257]|uniref:hypothetical protein n=1 Tax=Micromonospora sp. NPDC049257 TaxID=3155771 RepID=UPI003443E599